MQHNSTQRFSDRVEHYIRYRPGYPWAVVEWLRDELHLAPGDIIADIGSGTGILSELLLRYGAVVYGVEPNGPMRQAGESLLAAYPAFTGVDATAERTTLLDGSVDMVTAGQAFHWFDREAAVREFRRILRPAGCVVLVWNERRNSTPFLRDYDRLLTELATDYTAVNHTNIDEQTLRELLPQGFRTTRFDNVQMFDYAGLEGRVLSSSYVPLEGHPNHEPLMKRLRDLFALHAVDGQVAFEYDTVVYAGRPAGLP